jgi:hypothetical protein
VRRVTTLDRDGQSYPYFPLSFMSIHSSPKLELKCPAPYENLIDLDDDLDVLFDDSGLCTFDDADGDNVMMLAFE